MIPSIIVLDPSVLVASVSQMEDGHQVSRALMRQLAASPIQILMPVIGLPELASGLGRGRRSQPTAFRLLARFRETPNLHLRPVFEPLADAAAELALSHRIKGCDAVYVALAREMQIPLITLDQEQAKRAPVEVRALTPEQALAEWFDERSAST